MNDRAESTSISHELGIQYPRRYDSIPDRLTQTDQLYSSPLRCVLPLHRAASSNDKSAPSNPILRIQENDFRSYSRYKFLILPMRASTNSLLRIYTYRTSSPGHLPFTNRIVAVRIGGNIPITSSRGWWVLPTSRVVTR